MTTEKARQILNTYCPQKSNKLESLKLNSAVEYDLAIIIPVYNAQDSIKNCLDSVFNQKINYTYRVIAIDDGSTDDSLKLLNDYKNTNLIVIHQQNSGAAGARNTALRAAKSKYVMFLDADDTLTENSINKLMDVAEINNANIVEGNILYQYQDGHTETATKHNNNNFCKKEEISGFPVAKVIKKEFFNNTPFPTGYWFEDSVMLFLIIPQAERVSTIEDNVYCYYQNPNGATAKSKKNNKSIDTYWITELLYNEYKKRYSKPFPYIEKQIFINFDRTRSFQTKVKKAIFVLTRELIKNDNVSGKMAKAVVKNHFLEYEFNYLLKKLTRH